MTSAESVAVPSPLADPLSGEPQKPRVGRPLGCRDKGPRRVGTKPLGRPRKKKIARTKPLITENPSADVFFMDIGAYNSYSTGIVTIIMQLLLLLWIIQASIAKNPSKTH